MLKQYEELAVLEQGDDGLWLGLHLGGFVFSHGSMFAAQPCASIERTPFIVSNDSSRACQMSGAR